MKTLQKIVFSTCALLLAWAFVSFVDVVAHNVDPNPVYHTWNIFILLFG